jgi:hypothetical protein
METTIRKYKPFLFIIGVYLILSAIFLLAIFPEEPNYKLKMGAPGLSSLWAGPIAPLWLGKQGIIFYLITSSAFLAICWSILQNKAVSKKIALTLVSIIFWFFCGLLIIGIGV